jgi:cytochrome c oxidase subunit 2
VRIELPRDVSLNGHLVDGVLRYLTVATGICFTVAVGVLAVAVVFHRARGGARKAHYTRGDRPRHVVLTLAVALAMFVAVDVVLAARASRELRGVFWRYPDGGAGALRVEVTARQWAWTFRYAGPDGRFGTPDDVVTLNELHVPVGRPVTLQLRSRDVIHSLYLPSFRTKIDAIPGSVTRLWFQAQEAGRFEIGCAQHCGVGHYKMRGLLLADAPADYARWSARAEEDARLRYDAAEAAAQRNQLNDDAWEWDPTER